MTTREIAGIIKRSPITVLRYAEEHGLGKKISDQNDNSPFVFTESESKKIIKHFSKGAK
jgi:hypothetical protein